jgi:hypothetical protein
MNTFELKGLIITMRALEQHLLASPRAKKHMPQIINIYWQSGARDQSLTKSQQIHGCTTDTNKCFSLPPFGERLAHSTSKLLACSTVLLRRRRRRARDKSTIYSVERAS